MFEGVLEERVQAPRSKQVAHMGELVGLLSNLWEGVHSGDGPEWSLELALT